ncbi:MAG TPA: PH domain-containing protein [Thermoflexales bacterium]|nr:PH domain-containing protein [Thermoflexales bacterium]HQW34051.1 PH domain-containing protein [Thermoflexales bacterium]HQX76329.1 PH domain-containing protein [Thermoflexales bacterium]HQZ22502.1 PH domain-containing protein [Thermoflexales bacterium]HRA00087.1 PH domain-containing protein [Thermoflexales bacterium]
MIVFDTDGTQAYRAGVIAAVICGVVALLGLVAMALLPVTILTVILAALVVALILLAAWALFHARALNTTSYALDRNAFVIRYGSISEVIPMGEAQQVLPASELAADLKLRKIPLTNWWIGTGRAPGLPPIHFYANAPLEDQLVLVTPERAYAISPFDADGLVDAFEARHEMRPTQMVQHTRVLPSFLRWGIWQNRLAQFLLAALGVCAFLLMGLAAGRFPALRGSIPLHFNAAGLADRFAGVNQIFTPALFGVGLVALNALIGIALMRRGERAAAYLAWGGGVLVALGFVAAIITIGFGA